MPPRLLPTLLIACLLLIAAAMGYRLVAHALLDHRLTVDEAPWPIEQGGEALPAGRGLQVPPIISDLPTEDGPSLRNVALRIDANGPMHFYAASPAHQRGETQLFTRRTSNLFGAEVLVYHLTAEWSLFSDDRHHIVFSTSGGGHAGYTVLAEATATGADNFLLTVHEQVFGDRLHFQIPFRIGDEGLLIDPPPDTKAN